jgi:hypothetical protein
VEHNVPSITVDPLSSCSMAAPGQTPPSASVPTSTRTLVVIPAPKALKPKKLIPKKSKL